MHASMEVIRNAWRKQSLKNHPDKLVNAPKVNQLIGEERMKRINNAYEILHDPILRAQHDRVHPPAPQPQTGMIRQTSSGARAQASKPPKTPWSQWPDGTEFPNWRPAPPGAWPEAPAEETAREHATPTPEPEASPKQEPQEPKQKPREPKQKPQEPKQKPRKPQTPPPRPSPPDTNENMPSHPAQSRKPHGLQRQEDEKEKARRSKHGEHGDELPPSDPWNKNFGPHPSTERHWQEQAPTPKPWKPSASSRRPSEADIQARLDRNKPAPPSPHWFKPVHKPKPPSRKHKRAVVEEEDDDDGLNDVREAFWKEFLQAQQSYVEPEPGPQSQPEPPPKRRKTSTPHQQPEPPSKRRKLSTPHQQPVPAPNRRESSTPHQQPESPSKRRKLSTPHQQPKCATGENRGEAKQTGTGDAFEDIKVRWEAYKRWKRNWSSGINWKKPDRR